MHISVNLMIVYFYSQTGSRAALQASAMHLTCAVYSHDGREILGSYNDEDVYLFDAQADVYDKSVASHSV